MRPTAFNMIVFALVCILATAGFIALIHALIT